MSSTLATGAVAMPARPALRTAAARFARTVLLYAAGVGVLPAIFVALGLARLSGLAFWILCAVAVGALVIQRRPDALLAVLIALTPFLNLLRGFAFYNVVAALLLFAVGYRFAAAPSGALPAFFRRHPFVPWLGAFLLLFWGISFALTGRYDVNSRVWEFLLTIVAVLVLGRSRSLLSPALGGFLLSTVLVGLSMVPHLSSSTTDRLGIVVLDGKSLGNPIQLGAPLALGFLCLVVDRGGWIGLARRPLLRVAGGAVVTALLLLTTSRAAWLVAASGVVASVLFVPRARVAAVSAAIGVLLLIPVLLVSPAGPALRTSFDRTFSEERAVRNRTSGRSDQWIVAWAALQESAGSLIWGHGPGSGPRIYARKSWELPSVEFQAGQEMSLHSIYMQLAVETGLTGLALYGLVLGLIGLRIVRGARAREMLLPLLAFGGYLIIAGTVSGTDTASGLFLGIGLLAASANTGEASRRRPAEPNFQRGGSPC